MREAGLSRRERISPFSYARKKPHKHQVERFDGKYRRQPDAKALFSISLPFYFQPSCQTPLTDLRE